MIIPQSVETAPSPLTDGPPQRLLPLPQDWNHPYGSRGLLRPLALTTSAFCAGKGEGRPCRNGRKRSTRTQRPNNTHHWLPDPGRHDDRRARSPCIHQKYTWDLCRTSDLHRGNLGFRIFHERGRKRVELAPAYGVSSAIGSSVSRALEFPIGGQSDTARIGAGHWREQARSCGLDERETLAAVKDVAGRLPDAFAQARIKCRNQDENKAQEQVGRRAEQALKHVQARAKALGQKLAGRRDRGLGR